jgi:oligoendopeptidase F
MLTSADARERRAAHEGAVANRHRFADSFAALMDMGAKRDLFQARSHRHPDCLSAELARYDVEPAVYLNLVQTIRDHLEPYHRYLRLRARLLHLDELHPADAFLPTVDGDPPRFTFAEARALVQESTRPLGPEYAARVRAAFDGGWMDVYPAPDKAEWGSAMTGPGVHPYVLLNYGGEFFDLLTVTHELGHALSFDLAARAQPFATADFPWFLSELPSTCNEVLLLQYLADRAADDRMRLVWLTESVERLNTLLFYRTQGADFQLAVHRHVEAGGTLSAEWLDEKQLELTRHYCGHEQGVMRVDDYVRSEWIRPNMLFAPFQDYFYVVGTVASLAIADRIHEEGPSAGRRYVAFLEAGSSHPPLTLLREAGVDLDTTEPILRALRFYDRLVSRMEAIADRLERAKTRTPSGAR